MSTPTRTPAASGLLSLTPVPHSSIPLSSEDPRYSELLAQLVNGAHELLNSLKQPDRSVWKAGKTFNHSYANHGRTTISTASCRNPPGAGAGRDKWFVRESRHKLGWGLMANYLLKNHTQNALRYTPSLLSACRLDSISPAQVELWHTESSLGPLATPRESVFLQLTIDCSEPGVLDMQPDFPEGQRRLLVVRVPCEHPDAPERKGFVRARGVRVEVVEEVAEGGVSWRVAEVVDVGGHYPRCMLDKAIPGEMASNVPSFLDFLESRKGTIDDLKYDSPFETVLPTTS